MKIKTTLPVVMIMAGFLPDGYEIPTGAGGFTKIENGETRLRILSKPFMYWKVWENGKATLVPYTGHDSKPAKPTTTPKDNVKHVWALIVWNYKTDSIEIWECDKATVQTRIKQYCEDADYGEPYNYDIKVTRTGSTQNDTEYAVIAAPPKEVEESIVDAYEATPINLENLLTTESPFINSAPAASEKANKYTGAKANATPPAKVVTPQNWIAGDPIPDGYKEKSGKLVKKVPFGG